jgi:putative methyltransferase (TIGR04325 family)
MTDKIFSVWEGVFNSFDEAGGNLDAFDSERWISKQQSLACEAIAKIDEGGSLTKDYPLPLVVAMLLDAHKKISILDFGGGMGIQYFDLIAKVPAAKEKVHYVIVDGESTLENKPSELSEFQNLIFKASLD